jgi:hypothetical protein
LSPSRSCISKPRASHRDFGLILFSDQIELYVPPRKGRRHVLRLVREVLRFEPQHLGTNLVRALDFVNHVISRRAIVFLVSDFQIDHPTSESVAELRRALRQTNRRHDLVAKPIEDSREQTLPDVGIIALEDAETSELIELNKQLPAVRQRFAEIAANRAKQLQRTLNAEAVDSLRLSTDQPYVASLTTLFENRSRKTPLSLLPVRRHLVAAALSLGLLILSAHAAPFAAPASATAVAGAPAAKTLPVAATSRAESSSVQRTLTHSETFTPRSTAWRRPPTR